MSTDNQISITTKFQGDKRQEVLDVGNYEILVTRGDKFRCTNIEAATVLKMAAASLLEEEADNNKG
jgi:hypothetical protein